MNNLQKIMVYYSALVFNGQNKECVYTWKALMKHTTEVVKFSNSNTNSKNNK